VFEKQASLKIAVKYKCANANSKVSTGQRAVHVEITHMTRRYRKYMHGGMAWELSNATHLSYQLVKLTRPALKAYLAISLTYLFHYADIVHTNMGTRICVGIFPGTRKCPF